MTAMRIYLSGPMTGLPDYNYPAFNQVAADLRAKGYTVENPAENPKPTSDAWSDWMRLAIKQMMDCDCVVMLSGWQASKGAMVEVRLAIDLGLTVSPLAEFLNLSHINKAKPKSGIQLKGAWVQLCVRADALLAAHAEVLSEDDTAFLTMLSKRKIVWGTPLQQKWIDKITSEVEQV